MAKKQKEIKEEVVEIEVVKISNTNRAVSIIPNIKNGRAVFEIVRFDFNDDGTCTKPEVIHSTINESTALTLLFQAAHHTLEIKYLRDTIKKLKGAK
jgi:hypothetical protein